MIRNQIYVHFRLKQLTKHLLYDLIIYCKCLRKTNLLINKLWHEKAFRFNSDITLLLKLDDISEFVPVLHIKKMILDWSLTCSIIANQSLSYRGGLGHSKDENISYSL